MTTAVAQRLKVKTLDHVTLVVKDLEQSRKFYVDVLGMDLLERPGFHFAGSWFGAGTTQIHLILENAESGPAGLDSPASSRSHHFAFEVADCYAATDWVKQAAVIIISGPKERPDGAVQTFVLDPDRHVVELCSPPQQPARKTGP